MAKIRAFGIVAVLLISTLAAFVPAAPAEDAGAPAPMDIAPMGTQRVVLGELFTGAWCGFCPEAHQAMQLFEQNKDRDEIVILAWHRNDQLSFDEGDERISWMGITGYPTSFFDGVVKDVGGGASGQAVYNRYLPTYNTRYAKQTPLRMTTEWTYDDMTGDGEVWINITAVETPTLTNLKLHTVVFENDFGPYNGGNGETHHDFVARDMLESEGSAGTTLSISNGETKRFSYTFDASSYAQDLEEIGVIAFVQSHGTTKEVLQASYVGVPVLPNVAPEIDNGQAAPLEATEDDEVTFKVWYRDTDDRNDDGPSEAKVYIKNGTSPETGHDLIPIPSGVPYSVGKWLRYTTTLAPGTYTYRFSATDGEDDATGDIGWNATQITILPRNKVPQMSSHSFAPMDGDTTTVFRFDVLYRDLDNDEPAEAKIYIDEYGYDMITDSTGPWNSWVTFYYETTLSVKSMYRFYYVFSDGKDSVRMPAANTSPNYFIGPEVVTPNNEPTLTNPLFTPDDGTRLDEFTFTIVYTDGEDDHPIMSYMYIDGVPYIMDPDGDRYDIGETFRKRTKLDLGEHSIYFVFNDGKNEVRFPVTGTLPGPTVINLDPVANINVPGNGVRFTPDDYVTFSAIGSEDPDSDMMTYLWTSSLDGQLSTLESFDKPLSEGMHIITLEVSDEFGGVHSTTVSVEVRPYLPHPYVESILASVEDPVEMDMVRYTATLANDGEIRAQGIEVRFLVDDVPTRTDTVTVDLDKTTDVTFTWEAMEGTHIITIAVGDESKTFTEVVTANSLPEVTAEIPEAQGGEAKFETGKEIAFTLVASDLDGDDLTYLWDFGDGVTSTQANPTHTYSAAATYPVTVTVTDSRGGVTIKDLTVTITKPKQDESPGFGAVIAASAFIVAMLAVAVRRREM